MALRRAGAGSLKGLCPFHDEKTPVVQRAAEPRHVPLLRLRRGRRRHRVRHEDRASSGSSRPSSGSPTASASGSPTRAAAVRCSATGAPAPGCWRPTSAPRSSTPRSCARRRPAPPSSSSPSRGFDVAAATTFGCGYAPAGWDALTKHLLAAGFSLDELMKAGLTKEGRRGPIDRFHRRLLWPIQDLGGDVVGFGARRLFDDDRHRGEVPQHLRHARLPQDEGAVRARPGQTRDRQAPPGRRRRGLHRRDGDAPGRRADGRRVLWHGVRRRAHRGDPAADRRRLVRPRRGDLHLRRRRGRPGGGAEGVRGRAELRRADLRGDRPRRPGPLRAAAEPRRHRRARPGGAPRAALRVRDPLDAARPRPGHRRGPGRRAAAVRAAGRADQAGGPARRVRPPARRLDQLGRHRDGRAPGAGDGGRAGRARAGRPERRAAGTPRSRRRRRTTRGCTASARRSRRRCRCPRSPVRATTSCPSRCSPIPRSPPCTGPCRPPAACAAGGAGRPGWRRCSRSAPRRSRSLVTELAVEPLQLPAAQPRRGPLRGERHRRGAAGAGRGAGRGAEVAAAAHQPRGGARRLHGGRSATSCRWSSTARRCGRRPRREPAGCGAQAAGPRRAAGAGSPGSWTPTSGCSPRRRSRRRPPGRHLARAVAARRRRRRRLGWHLVSKATWENGALTLVEAEERDELGGAVLLADRPPQRLRLADPGRVPEAVHARVEGSIRSRHHRDLPGGGALVRAAQGRGPGRHGAAGAARPGHRRGRRAPGRRRRRPDAGPASDVSTTWDPALYLGFDDHRSRPFHDLLARSAPRPRAGWSTWAAGPGHLTGLLAARWPDAEVSALDSSPEMVAAARERGIDAQRADVVDWMPAPDTDVVVTNAVLQWVPRHRELLPRWLRALPPGAWFAMQVPGNFGAPSHALVRELLAEPRWRGSVELRGEKSVPEPAEYAELLVRRRRGRRRLGDHVPAPADRRRPGAATGSAPPPCARCATRSPPTTTPPSAPSWPRGCEPPTRSAPTARRGSRSGGSSRSPAPRACPADLVRDSRGRQEPPASRLSSNKIRRTRPSQIGRTGVVRLLHLRTCSRSPRAC